VEVREYDRLFKVENPQAEEGEFLDYINENSLKIIPNAYAEPAILEDTNSDRFQFMRKGYYAMDKDSSLEKLVFNGTVSLRVGS
jgi:glutaminyl-tRNA synthetase